MKALVLCGGIPQAALIKELKNRGIYTILADMNPHVMARPLADEFYPVSVLDVDAVKRLAEKQKVDMVLTACADQVLLVQAQVSEELGLPCYIDYKTAKDVSSKELMKKVFVENGIPTSKHVIMGKFDEKKVQGLSYPIIVKPVDSYSSRGVRKVFNMEELKAAFDAAVEISRTNTAIVEEYVEGEELTVDVYIEDGTAHTLCISNIDKIPGNDRFVICRTRYPAQISDEVKKQVEVVAGQIAKAFNLKNSPMLVQMITDGKKVSVVEFCARTGGGDKFRLIKQVSNFDVINAVVDLTLGEKPHVEPYQLPECIVNEFLYAVPSVFDHLEGFEEMKDQGIISEFFQLKNKGTECGDIKSSGDRVAYYTIQAPTIDEVREKDKKANAALRVVDSKGNDVLRHDLIAAY
jgi:biotin carboxylase